MNKVEIDCSKLLPGENNLNSGHGPGLWPLRERLALSSIVADCNNQQIPWNNIGRSLQKFTPPGADISWCSAKNCAKQYCLLMDSAEIYRKNNRTQISHLPVPKILLKKLTIERMEELSLLINANRSKNEFLKLLKEKIQNKELSQEQLADLKQYYMDKKARNVISKNVNLLKLNPHQVYEENKNKLCDYLKDTYFYHKDFDKTTWSTQNHAPSHIKSSLLGEVSSARQSTMNLSVLEGLSASRRSIVDSSHSNVKTTHEKGQRGRRKTLTRNPTTRKVKPDEIYDDEPEYVNSDDSVNTESTMEMDCTQLEDNAEEDFLMSSNNDENQNERNNSKLKVKINLNKSTVELDDEENEASQTGKEESEENEEEDEVDEEEEEDNEYDSSPEHERNIKVRLRSGSSSGGLQSTPKIENDDPTIDSFQEYKTLSAQKNIDYSLCIICQESHCHHDIKTNHPYNFGKTQGYQNIVNASKVNPTLLASSSQEKILLKLYTTVKTIEDGDIDKSPVDVLLQKKAFYHQFCYDIIRKFKIFSNKNEVSGENSETSSIVHRIGTPSITNSSMDSGPSSPFIGEGTLEWQKIAKDVIDKTMRFCRSSTGRSFNLNKDLRELQGLVLAKAFLDGVHFAHDFMAVLSMKKMSLIINSPLESSNEDNSNQSGNPSNNELCVITKAHEREELISKIYSLVEVDINKLMTLRLNS